nr:capsid protein [Chrysovirus sp.]
MALNPMELKRSVQEEKSRVYRDLRDGADGLRQAIKARDQLETWDPSTRQGALRSLEKKTHLGRDIAALLAYFENLHSPALDLISQDAFQLMYQIHGDIDRRAVVGANTVSVHVAVRWEKFDVKVTTYAGELDRLMSQPKLAGFGRNGIPNRDEVAKNTGWNRNDVRNFPDDQMYMLSALLEQMNTGQSKITRLVKGFLLLLEVSERGSVDFTVGNYTHVQYAPMDVVQSFGIGDRAYVYNSKPASIAHTVFLLRMCEQYPPQAFGSHVTIPGDAGTICMVSQGGRVDPVRAVTLTPGLIYSSLLTYAMDTSCTGLLQQAQIIACSLHQNRYFSTVELPRVVSFYDLMIPAFVADSSTLYHSMLSHDLGKSVGRIHQMLAFVVAKDMIVASNLQAKRGFNPASTIRTYLNSNSALLHKMASTVTGLTILDVTPKLRIFQKMTEADYADMLNMSIFEGLWLVRDATKSINNGPISFLKQGDKVRTGDVAPYDELKEELALGNVTVEDDKIPDGAFTTSWVGVESINFRKKRETRKRRKEVELVKSCEFRPGEDLKKRGGRRRRTVKYSTREPPNKVPLVAILRTPERQRQPRSAETSPGQVSEPPPYESGRSESPITTESERSAEEAVKPLKRTELAQAARRRLGQNSLSMLLEEVEGVEEDKVANQLRKNQQILKSLAQQDPQLLPEEQLESLLKRGGLGGSEREEMKGLVMRHLDWPTVRQCRGMEALVVELTNSGLKGESQLLRGNNKFVKVLNAQIERSNPTKFPSEVSRMREQGSKWEGEITEAVRSGLRYVARSESFREWLIEQGADLDQKIGDKQIEWVLLDKLVANNKFPLEQTPKMIEWLDGVSIDLMPDDISSEELPDTVPAVLGWFKAPTSMGERKFKQDDSRWLLLAAELPTGRMERGKLIGLCSEFRVPPYVREALKEKYGLFQGKEN